ncbi:predicted protein [Phaeodactylum tricornutum CCAP 1055/1]|uniref:C2 domain-containing protein n=2 Tax=Phaeodactylum tricornutum TaxID=2850 RepID=B7GAH7_PHATC|nr:predicted protein [Phaeodactylum tricornutum CCAP 1055/1]EEC44253.1 predicted protein [Phaeodactylum tricornutum CCAP 1055/1]|eukprot:XP_002184075.1 predicted protein [Phaeodactylum tricornutum CCAP 1055/1]
MNSSGHRRLFRWNRDKHGDSFDASTEGGGSSHALPVSKSGSPVPSDSIPKSFAQSRINWESGKKYDESSQDFSGHRSRDDSVVETKLWRNKLTKNLRGKFSPRSGLQIRKRRDKKDLKEEAESRFLRTTSLSDVDDTLTRNDSRGWHKRNGHPRNLAHAKKRGDDSLEFARKQSPPSSTVFFEQGMYSAASVEELGYETMTGFTDAPKESDQQLEMKRANYGTGHSKRKFRLRPHHCFEKATYMTEEDIYSDSIEPSQSFEFLKSYLAPTAFTEPKGERDGKIEESYGSPETDGRVGALRVEVLGCVSLARQKPDVATYLVCGDSAFCTDVISGYRSPMWPSASKRAAVFPIHHAFSRLYIGVFDVKARKSNKQTDAFCGRVTVDICSLRPGTEYDITLALRASTFVYDRRRRGVVRLRFSLHWFSERGAILSYFNQPRSLVQACPLVSGSPVIPCAEPRTFRNLALTVHGQDLPGKYSRSAFRATMREFNLYQVNIRHLLKTSVIEAVLYEKPIVSFCLFLAGMHCVVSNSVHMVPPYFLAYLLIQLHESYQHYVQSSVYNCGYKPLTFFEVFQALIFNTTGRDRMFESISVAKQAKQRGNIRQHKQLADMDSDRGEGGLVTHPPDHQEFPFSDRDAYPNFGVDDALAPSLKKGRAIPKTDPSGYVDGISSDESGDADNDDETITTETGMDDSMFHLDMEGEDDGLEPDDHLELASQSNLPLAASNRRRIKLGPAQNTDTSAAVRVPPQIHLKKMENIFHKLSKKLSVELVAAPMDRNLGGTVDTSHLAMRGSLALTTEALQAQEKLGKKAIYDEFDRLLGLETRTANPVLRIASAFLGPLMRIIRNIFLRTHLENKAAKTPKEHREKTGNKDEAYPTEQRRDHKTSELQLGVSSNSRLDHRKVFFRKNTSRELSTDKPHLIGPLYQDERPVFSVQHGSVASRKLRPRSVAIPYNRLRKERFYDWPPDPTVSRATPLHFAYGEETERRRRDNIFSSDLVMSLQERDKNENRIFRQRLLEASLGEN